MENKLLFSDYHAGDLVTYIGRKGIRSGFILEVIVIITPLGYGFYVKYLIEVIGEGYSIDFIRPSNIINKLG